MSIYPSMRSPVPGYQVDVGWDRERQSYFVQAFDMQGVGPNDRAPLVFASGYDEPLELPNLYSLLDASWTLVDWMSELNTLRQLRDDPLIEARDYLRDSSLESSRSDSRFAIQDLVERLFATPPRNSPTPMRPRGAHPQGTVPITSARRRERPAT